MVDNTLPKRSPKARKSALTAEHKKALATGREQGTVVRRYLEALDAERPKRGGSRRSPEAIQKALDTIDEKIIKANALARLQLSQARRELQSELKRKDSNKSSNIDELEAEFIKVASGYAKRKGISYGAWRDAGVSSEVLQKAGIPRTRR